MTEEEMLPHLILKVRTGSKMYGTNTENSDRDYVGVFIPPLDYVLGLKRVEQIEVRTNSAASGAKNTPNDIDCTYYALPKFIKLCMDGNPNILEVMYAQDTIEYCNEFGSILLKNKQLFLSNKIQKTFGGYALSQKQKLLRYDPTGNRASYIKKYGYDVKAASHIIRLLDECLELLTTGRLKFPLKDAAFIKQVKLGTFSLDAVLSFIHTCEENLKNCVSILPLRSHYNKINSLQIDLFMQYYHYRAEFSYLTSYNL